METTDNPGDATEFVLTNRLLVYTLLDRLFAFEPDESLIRLCANLHEQIEFLDKGTNGPFDEVYARMIAACDDSVESVDKLRGEYTRLFLGPGEMPVPAWESVFIERAPLLFQRSTLAVREAYRSSGFVVSGFPRVADDHLSTEMSFMAALSSRVSDAYATGDSESFAVNLEAQACFLDEHLLVWIDEYAQHMNEPVTTNKVGDFYPAAACFAAEFCHHDRETIDKLRSEG